MRSQTNPLPIHGDNTSTSSTMLHWGNIKKPQCKQPIIQNTVDDKILKAFSSVLLGCHALMKVSWRATIAPNGGGKSVTHPYKPKRRNYESEFPTTRRKDWKNEKELGIKHPEGEERNPGTEHKQQTKAQNKLQSSLVFKISLLGCEKI